MEKKAFELQKQARDNVNSLQTYLTDLENWELEMKRKEAALNGAFEQDLPPVRSKAKKDPTVKTKKKLEHRISASDYRAWEKFDADKACEDIDMENIGPASLDGSKSKQAKQEKLREEALYEKERGNTFVKNGKWDEAIACYNRAIELVQDDAIYYANRGLCYLKKDSLHQAETDCTQALKLDPTYVKALQRRATARERLGSLRAASNDLIEVLKLEPHNAAARRQLEAIKARMGTKGAKSKSSPSSTPTLETKTFASTPKTAQPKVVEMVDESVEKTKPQVPTALEKWRNGEGEKVTVIKPVKKPPHLRSKRPLKPIKIKEIPLGEDIEKTSTRMKIIEIDDSGQGDTNNNDSNKAQDKNIEQIEVKNETNSMPSPQTDKLIIGDNLIEQNNVITKDMVPPVNSVQFMSEWKYMKGNTSARCQYLTMIDPSKIPSIFENALESDVLSEVLYVLHENTDKFRDKTIKAYLQALCKVKRFSALAMFLTSKDKAMLTKLLDHCKNAENCSEGEIVDLKNKYEL